MNTNEHIGNKNGIEKNYPERNPWKNAKDDIFENLMSSREDFSLPRAESGGNKEKLIVPDEFNNPWTVVAPKKIPTMTNAYPGSPLYSKRLATRNSKIHSRGQRKFPQNQSGSRAPAILYYFQHFIQTSCRIWKDRRLSLCTNEKCPPPSRMST